MKFNTINNVAAFSTRDGTVYTAVAGVFTIANPTHCVDATRAGMTPRAEASDVAAGGYAESADSLAALAAASLAANVDTQMPPG